MENKNFYLLAHLLTGILDKLEISKWDRLTENNKARHLTYLQYLSSNSKKENRDMRDFILRNSDCDISIIPEQYHEKYEIFSIKERPFTFFLD